MDFVQKTNYAVAKLPEDFSDNILFNMNTPEDYRLAKKLSLKNKTQKAGEFHLPFSYAVWVSSSV